MGNWYKTNLREIADIIMGQSPDSKFYNSEGIGIKFLQGCAEFGEKYPKPKFHCSNPKKVAPKNSILFSVRAPVGKINIADDNYCIGRGLASIIPKNIDLELSYQLLKYFEKEYQIIAQGSTFESINSEAMKNLELYIPVQRAEQSEIAAILSKTDQAIDQTERIIAKYQRIKTGLMRDLLTKGIDENGNIRSEETHEFKDSPVGRIPIDWRIDYLGNQFTLQRGFDITQAKHEDGGIPVVSSSGVTGFHNKSMVKGPGVVIGRKGKLGNSYFIEGDFWPHDTTLWVCDFHGNSPEFTALFLGWLRLVKFDAATSVPTLNRNFIHPLTIAIPFIDEQKKICEKCEKVKLVESMIFQESINLSKYKKIKTGLMQDLLTGKVSVRNLLTKHAKKIEKET